MYSWWSGVVYLQLLTFDYSDKNGKLQYLNCLEKGLFEQTGQTA